MPHKSKATEENMTPEEVMKLYRKGFDVGDSSYQVHALLDECCMIISNLLAWIEKEGDLSDTCTRVVTGRICLNCRCKLGEKVSENENG
jgi:hypothetical protein